MVTTKSNEEVFSEIYDRRAWGRPESGNFYSGLGSHDPLVVETYVLAMKQLLSQFKQKPNVVDLGCGDFHIGKQIREFCDRYIACDVVPELIERNEIMFADLGVEFACMDITRDELPPGEVVFIRQVFQHMSNTDILSALPRLAGYKYLVLTEHLPHKNHFIANQDKPTNQSIRMDFGSGVILTLPPFNLQVRNEWIYCEAVQFEGIIRTTVYELG